jgi:hypothetical protein
MGKECEMSEESVEKACHSARVQLDDLWRKWMEEYPETVDQTLFDLVKTGIEQLKILVRLAKEVKE